MDQIARLWKSGLRSKSERDGGRRKEYGRKAGKKNKNTREKKKEKPWPFPADILVTLCHTCPVMCSMTAGNKAGQRYQVYGDMACKRKREHFIELTEFCFKDA